jgi:hypothetical protein
MKRVFLIVAVAALWVSGCEKKVEEPGGNTASVLAQPAVDEPAEAAPEEKIIPIEYKKAAETEITAENAEAKADELAKEIEDDLE